MEFFLLFFQESLLLDKLFFGDKLGRILHAKKFGLGDNDGMGAVKTTFTNI